MIELNGIGWVFLGGALGPLLTELLKVAASGGAKRILQRYKRPAYWLAFLALLVVSGVTTTLQGVEDIPVLRAVQLGIAAPALIGAWATSLHSQAEAKRGKGALPEMPAERSPLNAFASLMSW